MQVAKNQRFVVPSKRMNCTSLHGAMKYYLANSHSAQMEKRSVAKFA